MDCPTEPIIYDEPTHVCPKHNVACDVQNYSTEDYGSTFVYVHDGFVCPECYNEYAAAHKAWSDSIKLPF